MFCIVAGAQQIQQKMKEVTLPLGKIHNLQFTLPLITGYVQPKPEWFDEKERGSMQHYSAKRRTHSIKVNEDKSKFVQQKLLDARIWGSRIKWHQPQKIQFEKRNGQWKILNSVGALF